MKHVFVETNFIVELVRPFPGSSAAKLHGRANQDVALYVPWVSIVEAKRTLTEIIGADLGFDVSLTKFAAQEFRSDRLSAADKQIVDRLVSRAKTARANALRGISANVDAAVETMDVILPTEDVIRKTLALYPIKYLKPFDEMVMGAVLVKAEELYDRGERDLMFCNLNKKDFDPTKRPALAEEYERNSMTYHSSFEIP